MLDHKGHKAHEALKEYREHKDLRDLKEYRVLKDLRDLKAHRDQEDRLEIHMLQRHLRLFFYRLDQKLYL
jgi:hypothetical protein